MNSDIIQKLTEEEYLIVNELLDKLSKISNPYLFRKIALKEIVETFSVNGYSTVLWMNRFFSITNRKGEKGKVYSFIHNEDPPERLKKRWAKHINSSSSKIEQAIYEKYSNQKFGFVTIDELLDKEIITRNIIGVLARFAKIDELSFLWLQIDKNDFWCFCLRKFIGQKPFNSREKLMLNAVGEQILQMRQVWWQNQTDKPFSQQQLQVFDLRCQGYKRSEIAKALGLTENTVKSYLKHIQDKLNSEISREHIYLFGRIDKSLIEKHSNLTPYQIRILKMLLDDMTQQMIADDLSTSLATIKSQVDDIYKKFNTHKLQETLNKLSENPDL